MIPNLSLIERSGRFVRGRCRLGLFAVCVALGLNGCGSLNQGFANLVDRGTGLFATLDNAPGHVVIQFVNRATVDERLLKFLRSEEGGKLTLTDAEAVALHPRVRLRVRVTFRDGTEQIIEFVDGSSKLVDQNFNTQALPDLTKNTLNNVAVLCDVASVDFVPGTDIEVFIPVELTAFQLIQVTNETGNVSGVTFQARNRIPPRFQPLLVDDVDADGNTVVLRNFGTRDVPGPVPNVVCGSVIAIVFEGSLSVPFLDQVSTAPSFDQDDVAQVGSIGGRYSISVTAK